FVCWHQATSQVRPPKHESGAEHVKHSRAQNYSERFEAIKCAIVQVYRGEQAVGTPYGTGFYVSADGDIVTAAHVLGDKVWTEKDGGLAFDPPNPPLITVVDSEGNKVNVPDNAIEEN